MCSFDSEWSGHVFTMYDVRMYILNETIVITFIVRAKETFVIYSFQSSPFQSIEFGTNGNSIGALHDWCNLIRKAAVSTIHFITEMRELLCRHNLHVLSCTAIADTAVTNASCQSMRQRSLLFYFFSHFSRTKTFRWQTI